MMRLSMFLVCQMLAFSLTATAQDKTATVDPNVLAGQRANTILQDTATWQDLFNGKDLTGWTGDTGGYTVSEGVLVCKKGGKDLVSDQEYSDFAFQFQFKLEESGNNGIGIRVPAGKHPAHDGMEIQILDNKGPRYTAEASFDGKSQPLTWLKPSQCHGSIYGIHAAKTGYQNPVGQWNTETIVVIEDHIMVILNGAVIVDAFLDDLTAEDGDVHPGMKLRKGHLVLAGHSDRVEFRGLRLADYSSSPTQAATTDDNSPPEGFTALFNGKDLSGWKGLAHNNANDRYKLAGDALASAQSTADENMKSHWRVDAGVLTYDGKGQSLCTSKDYGDFEMYCDWKIPPGADSGIYLRGAPQIQIWDPWSAGTKPGQALPATPEDWVAAYKTGRNLGSGSLWNNRRSRNLPLVLADKKPGQWNRFLIRMVGEKVTIWLNDKLVVDRVRLENYWDPTGVVPLIRADQIELQHHGSELFFKNLYVRELPY